MISFIKKSYRIYAMSPVGRLCNTEKLRKFMAMAGIELFGIINKNGRMMDFLSRKDLDISNEKKEILFMQMALQSSMQREFDEDFGSVNFCVIQREKMKFICRPIGTDNMALVVTNKKTNDGENFNVIDDMCKMYNSEIHAQEGIAI